MALTINAGTYNPDTQRSPDNFRYQGPAHTHTIKDYVDLKRTSPKITATSNGYAKGEVKLTRTLTDGTDSVGDGIVSISVSFPVDAQTSEKELMLTDLSVFLGTTSADDCLISHDINQ
jgi:hypothetical protein